MRRYIFLLLISLVPLKLYSQASNRVALVQSGFEWGDTQKNLKNFEDKIYSIDSCDLIILPELFSSGCDMTKKSREVSTQRKDKVAAHYKKTIRKMQRWAKHTDAVIVGSTIYKEGSNYYNRLLAVYPTGEYLIYDKHNCFKKGSFTAGKDHLVIEVNGHRYATYICYDLRFPEWSQNRGRYDSAIYIANWPDSRRKDWNELIRQRAIENKAHVIAVNCIGTDLANIKYMGDSSVIDPNGKTLAKAKPYCEDIVIVEY